MTEVYIAELRKSIPMSLLGAGETKIKLNKNSAAG